jgi:hypothetical protein
MVNYAKKTSHSGTAVGKEFTQRGAVSVKVIKEINTSFSFFALSA